MRHLFFFAMLLLAGCTFDLGTDTTGDLGRASFAYTGPHCEILTCSVDHAALLHSRVTVIAMTDRVRAPAWAYFPNASIGRIAASHPLCNPELFRCQISVDIETTGIGDGALEIFDAKGGLIDKITIHVRSPARIDLAAAIENERLEPKDGAYEVAVGTKVDLVATVIDAGGNLMVHGERGLERFYRDESIVGPDGLELLEWAGVANLRSRAPGETTVSMRANDVSATARFRVHR